MTADRQLQAEIIKRTEHWAKARREYSALYGERDPLTQWCLGQRDAHIALLRLLKPALQPVAAAVR